ncbi:MAG: MFS transporter [Steroidobacteraceae bacterium]
MFGLLLLTYTLMAADRYLISNLAPDIRTALNLSLPQMGALTTMFTLGIGIAGLPAGALIARYSRKTVLLLGVLLFSIATLLFTKATGFASMFVFIVMQGVGMSFLATSMFALSASYFSANRVAALGIVNVCFGLGSFLGPWAIADIRTSSGSWQQPMYVFGFLGLAIAVIIAFTVRPWFSETKPAAKHIQATGGAASLINYNTMVLTAMSALYGIVIYGFLGLYPTFIIKVLGLHPADVGAIMKSFGAGSLLAFFGGKLGDKFSTKTVLCSCSLVLVLLGFFMYQPGHSKLFYQLMAALVGIFGAAIVYTNLAGGHVKALNRSLTSKGSSMFVTSVYGGAALGGYTMGKLVESSGWEFAGHIQISLASAIVAGLALTLRESEFSK